MYDVISVNFYNSNRVYYFSNNNLDIPKSTDVIVETEKGLQYATTTSSVHKKEKDKLMLPLKNVIRIATQKDKDKHSNNLKVSKKAIKSACDLAKKYNLDMKFIDASFTFDRNQLIFNFVADSRVDFRELAKKLASIYKTRIELRQIGVRDKAKQIGGIGPCGRFLCCNTFLNDFNSVSINMAKNQYISLNPTKINGICGRLLCCLNYEDEQYTDMKKRYPPIGTIINDNGIKGKVVSHNLFRETYSVEKMDRTICEVSLDGKSS